MKKLILALSVVLSLAGCASADYEKYLTSQEKIANDYKAASNVNAIAMAQIAKSAKSDVVQAVVAMSLAQSAGKAQGPMIAPPRNEFLEWFKAATPLLGTWINGHYALRSQEVTTNGQVDMYSTQMDAFKTIAVEGIRKEPLPVVVVPAAEPAATETTTP